MLYLISLISFVTIGLHYAFWYNSNDSQGNSVHWFAGYKPKKEEREILWFVKFYIGTWLFNIGAKDILKPLFTCPMCMPSIYGSIIYWSMENEISIKTICKWVVVVVGTTGLNKIITSICRL